MKRRIDLKARRLSLRLTQRRAVRDAAAHLVHRTTHCGPWPSDLSGFATRDKWLISISLYGGFSHLHCRKEKQLVSIRAASTYPARPSKLIRPKKKTFLSSVKRARYRSFADVTNDDSGRKRHNLLEGDLRSPGEVRRSLAINRDFRGIIRADGLKSPSRFSHTVLFFIVEGFHGDLHS